ncbi:MAG: tRNA pseudouridine(13) synthase TruD [Pseudomonas sp.]
MSSAEQSWLGPRAHGEPCGRAVLKAQPEHFRVTEILDIELSGQGEHLWLLIEKRDLNTEDVARQLARAAGIKLKDVSYAGIKDKRAITSQWFSLQLPGRADPDLSSLWADQLRCLASNRHSRKLQRGAHSANHFVIRLTSLQAEQQALDERLRRIAAQGVPNYFGPQRFGRDGGNVLQARQWAERGALPPARGTRSRVLSTARSLLFNQLLAQRVADGSWNRILPGDCLAFTDSRSHFSADRLAEDDKRFAELDIHVTGPLWGKGTAPVTGDVLQLEQQLAATEPQLCEWLENAGLEQQRRVLRLPIHGLTWHYPAADSLEIEFTLPTGCFATAVLHEVLLLDDEPGGGLESET